MHVLFVHPNFPAQFRYLAPRLAGDFGWRCSFASQNAKAADVPGVERLLYHRDGGPGPGHHVCTRYFEGAVGHVHGVYEALKARPDIQPDLVIAHSGFGSSLFLPQLYDAPVINFFEYFCRPVGQILGYRPELGLTEQEVLCSRTHNAMILLDLDNCDRGWCPNFAQRDTLPKEYHSKIDVIPEGVDTDIYRRRECAGRRLPDGTLVPAGTRVVTYVARGFELTRGFDIFLRAAKRIAEQVPDALFVVAGTDRPHYGADKRLTAERSLRAAMFEGGEFDKSRFHFTGWVPEQTLVDIFSISDLHIYLTVPFITSWSMLDAMSWASVVLASDQACTREYITHGHKRLDLRRVGDECDLAVHNANHGTLARLLMCGRPMLQLPLTLEQKVLARAVDRTGASLTVLPGRTSVRAPVTHAMDSLLATDRYAAAAKAFAAKYTDFDPEAQVRRIAARVEELLADAPGKTALRAAPSAAPRAAVPAGIFCS